MKINNKLYWEVTFLQNITYLIFSRYIKFHTSTGLGIKFSWRFSSPRDPIFGVSDQVQHALGCTTIEYDKRLKSLDFGSIGIVPTV